MLSKELLDDLSKNKQHHVIEIVKEMQCEDIETISKQIRCIDWNIINTIHETIATKGVNSIGSTLNDQFISSKRVTS